MRKGFPTKTGVPSKSTYAPYAPYATYARIKGKIDTAIMSNLSHSLFNVIPVFLTSIKVVAI